ncbi:interleukin-1 receptor-associated kinase-like 2 isoform X3 [Eumetopias jubatus]|uniref:interleukin-1 receptor-associated kinase-like 2 isoform X3 n=1 Tax=Eumetopias jubatus TaxID=34886 RepID=UPI00101676E1|nr:interleukin-1 receptor-associated kinase-like 2 isoform X3 [Eumetopias jubatus]
MNSMWRSVKSTGPGVRRPPGTATELFRVSLNGFPPHSRPQFPLPAQTLLVPQRLVPASWAVSRQAWPLGGGGVQRPAPPTSPGGGGRVRNRPVGPACSRSRGAGSPAQLPQLSARLPADPRSPAMSCYIYQLPAWVLDDLCRNMDTLSEWDWMQFASYVITDLTQLRKIKSMERVQGVSITRELLWWWGMRQATVQQLVDLLCRLQLYRAAQIVLNWKPIPEIKSSFLDFPDAAKPGRLLAASVRNAEDKQGKGLSVRPDAFPSPGPAPARASLLPPSTDAPHSLKTKLVDFPVSPDSKDFSTSLPKQETLVSQAEDSLFWSEADVVQATDNFNQNHKISEGIFADIYKGQRHGMPFVFKKLREVAYSGPGLVEKFFQAEVQICHRCCHPNILPLLGFCTGNRFYSLIYPYMANGSLQDRLQGQGGADPLLWPQRASICSGLLQAVRHLHGLEIIHGNVKSSNVLLDQNFTPKLAHPVAHLCPNNKRSKYTMMKTHVFQASAAYLPEDFIRVGQLTKRVDIFSCGIVLAEVLTGIPAMDNNRSPVYLKDLLLSAVPSSSPSLCGRKTGVETVMAKEICQKYLEKGAGRLLDDCAEALAMAACLCLRRRNASLADVCGSVAAVEKQLRGQETLLPLSGLSEGTGSFSNTPEETDDVDNSSLEASSSMRVAPGAGAAASLPSTEDGEGRLQVCVGVPADSFSVASARLEPPQDDISLNFLNISYRDFTENRDQ